MCSVAGGCTDTQIIFHGLPSNYSGLSRHVPQLKSELNLIQINWWDVNPNVDIKADRNGSYVNSDSYVCGKQHQFILSSFTSVAPDKRQQEPECKLFSTKIMRVKMVDPSTLYASCAVKKWPDQTLSFLSQFTPATGPRWTSTAHMPPPFSLYHSHPRPVSPRRWQRLASRETGRRQWLTWMLLVDG